MRLNLAVDQHAKAAQWQQALHLWSASADRNEVTYNSLISACHRGSQWQRALIVLKELEENLQATVISYSSTLSAFSAATSTTSTTSTWRLWRLALDLFQAMECKQLRRDVIVCNAAISACGERWRRTLRLLRGLQGTLISYNSAISSTEKAGEWQVAIQLMEELMEHQLLPDIITYNAVISACAKGGRWQEAISLYSALVGRRLNPSIVTCGSLISACEKAGRWQEALHVLEELPTFQVRANIITYNSAISSCEKRGRWQKALLIMAGIRDRGVSADVITFNSSISACEKGSRWLQASQLLSMLALRGRANIISFNSTISAHEECSRWSHALQTLQELGHFIPVSSRMTCNSVISACDKGSRWSQAFWFLDDLHRQSHRHDVVLLTCGLGACASSAQWHQSLALALASTSTSASTDILQSLAVTACVQQRHWREALGLHGPEADVLTVNLTMDAVERFRYWTQSLLLLEDLRAAERPASRPNAVSYSCCLSATSESGQSRWEPFLCSNLDIAGVQAVASLRA